MSATESVLLMFRLISHVQSTTVLPGHNLKSTFFTNTIRCVNLNIVPLALPLPAFSEKG